MKKFPLFLFALTAFTLCTKPSNAFENWEDFQSLKNNEDKKVFLQKMFQEKSVDTLIIGGMRKYDGSQTHWIIAPPNAVTVNNDPKVKAEFLADGLNAEDLTTKLAPLFQMMAKKPELRFEKIVYEHVQFSGSKGVTSHENIRAFEALMPLLARGGSFVYQSYMAYLTTLLNEGPTFKYEYERKWEEKKMVFLEALKKDKEKLHQMRVKNNKCFLLTQEDVEGCVLIEQTKDLWKEEGFVEVKFQRQIDLYKKLHTHCVEKYGEDSFEALSCKYKFSENELALKFSKFYRKNKTLNAAYYRFSKLPVLQINQKTKIDFSGPQADYFRRTYLKNFLKDMESRLDLKNLELSLNPGRIEYFYEISGTK